MFDPMLLAHLLNIQHHAPKVSFPDDAEDVEFRFSVLDALDYLEEKIDEEKQHKQSTS